MIGNSCRPQSVLDSLMKTVYHFRKFVIRNMVNKFVKISSFKECRSKRKTFALRNRAVLNDC